MARQLADQQDFTPGLLDGTIHHTFVVWKNPQPRDLAREPFDVLAGVRLLSPFRPRPAALPPGSAGIPAGATLFHTTQHNWKQRAGRDAGAPRRQRCGLQVRGPKQN